MNWQELCADPVLQDLPYKIELNQQGQLIMSPASVLHVILQGKIIARLNQQAGDCLIVPEFPIETSDGTKVVDVGMLTPTQTSNIQNNVTAAFAPVLCIEVLSPSNTQTEMQHKKQLYFDKGAQEFWLCDQNGKLSFYNQTGQLPKSELFPDFPTNLD